MKGSMRAWLDLVYYPCVPDNVCSYCYKYCMLSSYLRIWVVNSVLIYYHQYLGSSPSENPGLDLAGPVPWWQSQPHHHQWRDRWCRTAWPPGATCTYRDRCPPQSAHTRENRFRINQAQGNSGIILRNATAMSVILFHVAIKLRCRPDSWQWFRCWPCIAISFPNWWCSRARGIYSLINNIHFTPGQCISPFDWESYLMRVCILMYGDCEWVWE